MCILLKLHYAKFDLPGLFCSKVIEEKPLGGGSARPPPLGKGRVKPMKDEVIPQSSEGDVSTCHVECRRKVPSIKKFVVLSSSRFDRYCRE